MALNPAAGTKNIGQMALTSSWSFLSFSKSLLIVLGRLRPVGLSLSVLAAEELSSLDLDFSTFSNAEN